MNSVTEPSLSAAESGGMIPDAQPATVTTSSATCYTVLNGWTWAHMFVRHGVRQDERGPCNWAHLSVISDYGSFGFCWTHIGSRSWQEFFSGLNFDYAMNKLLGNRFMVPMSSSDAAEKARKLVLDGRRQGELSREDARELWDEIDLSDDGGTANDFLREWDRRTGGAMYRNEFYESRWEEPNPQAVGFWREIWPHFVAAIHDQRSAAA